MSNKQADTHFAVLEAMYDITEQNKRPGALWLPSRGEISRRTGIEQDEVSEALSFLTNKGFAQDETFGDDGPTYSITQLGREEVEGWTLESENVEPHAEHQPLIRDMDLVRTLLLYIAHTGGSQRSVSQPHLEEYSDELVTYHLTIMQEAGLIKGRKNVGLKWGLMSLTWEGQDFLSAAQNNTVWESVKKNAGSLFSGLTIAVTKELLVKEVTRRVSQGG